MTRLRAVLLCLVAVAILAWGASPPQASTEARINTQYPPGTTFTIQTEGVVATDGSCPFWPASTFKGGKLHAPGFMQNALLAASKCTPVPLEAGSHVSLSNIAIKVKGGKVDFVLLTCDAAGCPQNNGYKTQVTFEFPKGILEASGLPVLQEAVEHVLAMPAAAQATSPPPAQEPPAPRTVEAPNHGVPLYLYVSTQSTSDRLQLYQDGAFDLAEGGRTYTGSYAVSNTTLRLHLVELQKDVDLSMRGNQLVVNGDETWEMAPAAASPEPHAVESASDPAALPSFDRIGQAVNVFLGELKQKGAIPPESAAVPSSAPVIPLESFERSDGRIAQATGVFELRNTSYMCGSADHGPKTAKKRQAYVLSARVTEKQPGQWVLSRVQIIAGDCKPEWQVDISLP
jgi:hypothetical protein